MGMAYRVEFLLRATVLALLGFAAAAAVQFGLMTCAAADRHAAAEIAGATPVSAVVDSAPTPAPYPMNNTAEVPAHWSFAGRIHTGLVEAAPTAHQGDHVTVLVRPNGDRLPGNLTRGDAVSDGITAGFAVFTGALGGALLLDWMIARTLERRRHRAWEAEWAELAGVRRWNHL